MSIPPRLRPAEGVIFEVVEGEAILLHLESGDYYELNSVGTRAWELLHDQPDVEALHRAILGEFDVEPARLRGDLEAYLRDMIERGLVVEAES